MKVGMDKIVEDLQSGRLSVLVASRWWDSYGHPETAGAFDWLLGELLCASHPGDRSVRAAVVGYWQYACEMSLGDYIHCGKAWFIRDDRRAGERQLSQLGYQEDAKYFSIALIYHKKKQNPQAAYKVKIPVAKLRSSEMSQIFIDYLDAWRICGERLPQLIADGQCPVELPEVTL